MEQTYVRDGVERTVTRADFAGTWKNDKGSVMVLDHHGNQLVGTYRTAVGAPEESEAFALTGYAFGGQVAFTVDYSRYGSMTSWVGYLEGDTLHTLWHLVRVPDSPDDAWASVRAGSSRFTKA